MDNVLDFVFPKEVKFFDMLKEQSGNVLLAEKEFTGYLENFPKLSADERMRRVDKIKDIEGVGDKMMSLIFEELQNSLITPIDREDIHRLSMSMDDVVDGINKMAYRILLFKVKKIPQDFIELNKIISQQIEELDRCMANLKEKKDVKVICIKIQNLENEADKLINRALGELFATSKDPIEVIKLKDLFETMKGIATKSEDVTYIIQNIEVKHG